MVQLMLTWLTFKHSCLQYIIVSVTNLNPMSTQLLHNTCQWLFVGEDNKEQLIKFVGWSFEVYKEIIDYRHLPILVG